MLRHVSALTFVDLQGDFVTYAENVSTCMSEIPHEIKIIVVMINNSHPMWNF